MINEQEVRSASRARCWSGSGLEAASGSCEVGNEELRCSCGEVLAVKQRRCQWRQLTAPSPPPAATREINVEKMLRERRRAEASSATSEGQLQRVRVHQKTAQWSRCISTRATCNRLLSHRESSSHGSPPQSALRLNAQTPQEDAAQTFDEVGDHRMPDKGSITDSSSAPCPLRA